MSAGRRPVDARRPWESRVPAILEKVLRFGEGRIVKKLSGLADQVNALEDDFTALSDAELREETDRFKARLADGETLDDLLPEAFAAVREAARRTLGQRHFDVQLMGGAALHLGNIAEMKTGEGKTLVATAPAYLNALSRPGRARRHGQRLPGELPGRAHGSRLPVPRPDQRASSSPGRRPPSAASSTPCDITYGTNNEFGFDYLRDNMAWSHRGARPARPQLRDRRRGRLDPHRRGADAAHHLRPGVRRRQPLVRRVRQGGPPAAGRRATTRSTRRSAPSASWRPGIERVEDYLGIDNLYESLNTPLIGFLNNAIKAKELFKRDKDYVVLNGEVLIVDEHTGRILAGRRYNEGMHQAIEAKEGVAIKAENQTLATITLQNYFRLYGKLAGMTGTAETEAAEFQGTYKLGVVPIPTNRPMQRIDQRRPRLQGRGRQVRRRRRRHRRAARARAAGPGRHHERREERAALRQAEEAGRPARGPQRQAARARGVDRRPGRPQGRRHRRDQHGRPRDRHHARRQRRVHGDRRPRRAGPEPGRDAGGVRGRVAVGAGEGARRRQGRARRGRRRSVACTCWAPSATSPAASTTSSAVGPAARATRASPGSTCRCRTTSCACSTRRWPSRS